MKKFDINNVVKDFIPVRLHKKMSRKKLLCIDFVRITNTLTLFEMKL